MKGLDPTKAIVTVTYRTIPTLLAELVIMATKMGDDYKVCVCVCMWGCDGVCVCDIFMYTCAYMYL